MIDKMKNKHFYLHTITNIISLVFCVYKIDCTLEVWVFYSCYQTDSPDLSICDGNGIKYMFKVIITCASGIIFFPV